jgi:hypothetical protein
MKEILPGIDISNINTNKEKWKEQIEHYDNLLGKLDYNILSKLLSTKQRN